MRMIPFIVHTTFWNARGVSYGVRRPERGCAGLTSCLAGRRRTSSANANAKQQVIAQRISDQFLERCSAHAALVVELCGNPAARVDSWWFPPCLRAISYLFEGNAALTLGVSGI